MERIGNIGWFLSDEEYERISNSIIVISEILDSCKVKACKTQDYHDNCAEPLKDAPNITYPVLNEPIPTCPHCPWKGDNPWKIWQNPADWTVRPEHLPWYGDPGEPISPKEWKVGDGEWWKHQPYCTSTTEDNPNAVKDTKTSELTDKLRNLK